MDPSAQKEKTAPGAARFDGRVFAIFEDRASAEEGVRLVVDSISTYDPDTKIYVVFNERGPDFDAWLAGIPNAHRIEIDTLGQTGWSVKPELLLYYLQNGASEAIWIDSDIMTSKSVAYHFDDLSSDAIVTSENPKPENLYPLHRTEAWGLELGREFPFWINSCVVRVTHDHLRLLQAWRDCVNEKLYREAQENLSYFERPLHLRGDQDVLEALICSTKFSHFPVKALRSGRDVLHIVNGRGTTPVQRLRYWRYGFPSFIHAQGSKPWLASSLAPVGTARHAMLPYCLLAEKHANAQLGDSEWSKPKTYFARLLRVLGEQNSPRTGMPLVLLLDSVLFAEKASIRIYWKLKKLYRYFRLAK